MPQRTPLRSGQNSSVTSGLTFSLRSIVCVRWDCTSLRSPIRTEGGTSNPGVVISLFRHRSGLYLIGMAFYICANNSFQAEFWRRWSPPAPVFARGRLCAEMTMWGFIPIPCLCRARLFPHQGFTGVCIENRRACGWDFTPIPAFPLDGGRSLRLGFSAIPAIFSNELYMRCSNTCPLSSHQG